MERTTELDSVTFAAMLRQGAAVLGKEKATINDLNVFPIPDGDTGDNMYMTMKAGCAAVQDHLGTLSEIAAAASSGMLLGARGNSGVILSRIFAGLAKGLKGVVVADTETFARAMNEAVSEAYKSVPVPVEGTMLTVLREGVAGADASSDLNRYFETLLPAMQASLDHTPELLQVLRDAGVVDSGGAGLCCVFRGMDAALCGQVCDEELLTAAAPAAPTVDLGKFTEDSTLEFGYCTEFLLRLMRSKVDPDTFDERVIIDYLNRVGESVVAFREGTIVKVHVHTFTPGVILNEMQRYGEFLTLKIENMSLQHNEWKKEEGEASFSRPQQRYGVVTVAMGMGMKQRFEESGADVVIEGGQTMNPSTQDFVAAFRQLHAQHILVFPNNPNIRMAAEQAASLYKGAEVHVMPSATLGEGYYGVASVDRSLNEVEAVIQGVNEVMQSVVTGMVSTAIRDAEGDNVTVRKGDFVGYSGKRMLSDSPNRSHAVQDLVARLGAAERDVMVVFYGERVPAEEAQALAETLAKTYPMLEIMLNNGGQPIYDYILVLC
jgi:hypothetical protein